MSKYRSRVDQMLYHHVYSFHDKGRDQIVLRHWAPWKRRWFYSVVNQDTLNMIYIKEK